MLDGPSRSGAVAVIGYGAIGRALCTEIEASAAVSGGGFRLAGVVSRSELPAAAPRRLGLAQAVAECDLIVEAAGHRVVADHGADILGAGVDLLVVSVGAVADPGVSAALQSGRPGRAFFASGAIGGLGLLAAAHHLSPLYTAALTTTKKPRTLVQPWMSQDMARRLNDGESMVVFDGTAREAARLFPRSANVAASLAIALDGWDWVRALVKADACALLTSHVIEASGGAGHYRFDISNEPDPRNPATSGVVAHNVARAVSLLMGRGGQII
jgi:aspartate dehydrogenase